MESKLDAPQNEIVELRNVTKSFKVGRTGIGRSKEVQAVRGISAVINRGQSVGIVGESGSGKTTLARMIMGLESPTSGQILLDGELRPKKASMSTFRAQARKIQMVFQDPNTSLNQEQTIHDAVDEVLRVHFHMSKASRDARTRELLNATGLGEQLGASKPRDLSGGQRQRAAIARALAADPQMLVLDEAVSALDVSVQAQVLNLLADLRDEFNLTYLLISHDLAVVRFLCDSVLVMNQGSLVESGDCVEVLMNPKEAYTERLVAAVPQVTFE